MRRAPFQSSDSLVFGVSVRFVLQQLMEYICSKLLKLKQKNKCTSRQRLIRKYNFAKVKRCKNDIYDGDDEDESLSQDVRFPRGKITLWEDHGKTRRTIINNNAWPHGASVVSLCCWTCPQTRHYSSVGISTKLIFRLQNLIDLFIYLFLKYQVFAFSHFSKFSHVEGSVKYQRLLKVKV